MSQSVRYLRRSKGKSAQERANASDTVSVEDQRRRTYALEAQHGYEHVREFVDDGLSAWKEDVARPDFDALCRYVVANLRPGDVVVADAPDRISRQGGEAFLAFRRLCGSVGVRIHTISNGLDDPQDDNAEIPAYLVAWQAQQESKNKSRRLRQRSAERAAAGEQRNQGVTPFGWSADDRRVLDPAHAALLQEAKDRVLRGGTLRGIVRAWNEAGLQTTRGGAWSHQTLRAVLTRPRNAGLMQHRREVLEGVTGDWEPLWDRETHDALVAVLGNRALTQMSGTGRRRGYSANSLLAGLLRCRCGGPMRYCSMPHQEDVYRCDAPKGVTLGPHVTIQADVADQKARQALVATLMLMDSGDLPESPETAALAALHVRRAQIKEEVGRLVAAVRSGALTGDDVAQDRADLDREATQVQEEIDRITSDHASAALITDLRRSLWEGVPSAEDAASVALDLQERLPDLDLEDQRALVRAYLDIQVGTGRGADRMQITRKVPTPVRTLTGTSSTTPTGITATEPAEAVGEGQVGGLWVHLDDGRALFAG